MGNDAPSRKVALARNAAPSRSIAPSRSTAPSRRAALAALLSAALVTGCSGGARSVASGGTATLRYFFWGEISRAELINQCIDVFERGHPKIRIKASFVGFDPYLQKVTTALAGGNPPDVLHVDYAWLRTFAHHDLLADLGEVSGPGKEIDVGTVVPALRTAGLIEDRRVGLPLSRNSIGLMYDAGLYAKAGAAPPDLNTSWDAFVEETAKIRKFTKGAQAGVDNPGQNYMGVEMWMMQHGRTAWTESGQLGYTPDDLREYLTFIERWRETGGIASAREILESKPNGPVTLRRAAAVFEWDNQIGSRSEVRGTPLKLTTPPTDTGRSGLYAKPGMLISAAAATPYLSEAAQFINFMINDRRVAQILGTNIGMAPTTSQQGVASMDDPFVRLTSGYEKRIEDVAAPTPPAPGIGGNTLNVRLERIAEKVGYGALSVDEAVEQYFDQVKFAAS
ncbi:ABC transporter substrate-binding protein [Streptomyces monticola]|uniref:ABC transporter substrate-binding protein n=1 Tax=Streptomyces monticola TaxID=2666263 RepID=A0ABW2JF38_9ACTN